MSKAIHIKIEIGNAAFEDVGGAEVARILRELANSYDEDGMEASYSLRDINGNAVGTAKLRGK